LAVLGACSGKPRPEEAARPPAAGDAAPGDAAGDAAAHPPGPPRTTRHLPAPVERPDGPGTAPRPPRGPPRRPPPAPPGAPRTTTWGIPDALVLVEGAPRAGAPPSAARVTLADCALTPRIAAGAALAITSAVDRPTRLVLRKRGAIDHLAAGDPVPVQLPLA